MLALDTDPAHRRVRFVLVADAEPGLLPRVLEPFAKRDLIPDQIKTRRDGPALGVDILLAAMPAETIHRVEGDLRRIIGLRRLEVVLYGTREGLLAAD